MKRISKLTWIAALLIAFCNVTSCKKRETTEDIIVTTHDTMKPKPVVLEDTLKGNWIVNVATHNGSPDNSSKGLKLEFKTNGKYTLISTGYLGTWEFIENRTKVLIDKDMPEYKTSWTIVRLTAKNMDVTFKSPFTGGNSEWHMVRY